MFDKRDLDRVLNRFYLNLLGLKTEVFEPNPKFTTNHEANDCFIRACCKLLDKDWDTVFHEVYEIAFEEKVMLNSIKVVAPKYLKKYGYEIEHIYFSDQYTIGEKIYENINEDILIGNNSHVICVKHGIIYDNQYNINHVDAFLTSLATYIIKRRKSDEEG